MKDIRIREKCGFDFSIWLNTSIVHYTYLFISIEINRRINQESTYLKTLSWILGLYSRMNWSHLIHDFSITCRTFAALWAECTHGNQYIPYIVSKESPAHEMRHSTTVKIRFDCEGVVFFDVSILFMYDHLTYDQMIFLFSSSSDNIPIECMSVCRVCVPIRNK